MVRLLICLLIFFQGAVFADDYKCPPYDSMTIYNKDTHVNLGGVNWWIITKLPPGRSWTSGLATQGYPVESQGWRSQLVLGCLTGNIAGQIQGTTTKAYTNCIANGRNYTPQGIPIDLNQPVQCN